MRASESKKIICIIHPAYTKSSITVHEHEVECKVYTRNITIDESDVTLGVTFINIYISSFSLFLIIL